MIFTNKFYQNLEYMKQYKFVQTLHDSDNSSEEDTYDKFYQLCCHPNPDTKRYELRRYIIDKRNNISEVKDYHLSKGQYKKFLAIHKPHQYKCYSVCSLSDVGAITMSDILISKSDILTNNYDYYGYAPWK